MNWAVRRRFWTVANVRAVPGGFAVMLDARELTSPAKTPLVVPTAALAEAIVSEWNAVGDVIEPESLHYTRAANSAIDRVAPRAAEVAANIAAYGDSDLLCYRAVGPEALRAREKAAWDPWLDWSAHHLAAPLVPVEGVMPRPQPEASRAALRDAVAAHGVFELAALHDLVTLSGSLVLGLAVSRGALAGTEAWAISRIDESWQEEQWGIDAEAEAAAGRKQQAFLRAERLIGLLRRNSAGRQ